MFLLKCIFVILLTLGDISEILSSDYLHFGGTEEESRQAAYYLSADSGTNIGPTDELKRTQRSFWKKLFKNGLFGECENCCDNCNYNAGNGDTYNPIPSSLLPFQPWRPLPLWRPLQPLFGPINYDNYGTNSYGGGNSNNYGNPPSYDMNNYGGEGYDNSVSPAPEPVYEIPTDLSPENPDYKTENSPVTEDIYEPPNVPEQPSYTNTETAKGPQQFTNGKIPQIIYQPIIYVSPQYQGNRDSNPIKDDENKYNDEPEKEDEKDNDQIYETGVESEDKSSSYGSEAEYTKSDNGSTSDDAIENQSSDFIKPCNKKDDFSYAQQSSHPHTNPSVSTVSTIYNIITPSLLHSLGDGQSPYSSGVIASNIPYINNGPSKYSLTPSNNVHLDSYSLPAAAASPTIPETTSSYESSKQTYTQPIPLTPDDQPYRVCPELFQDYQRKLNSILPYIHAGRGGNTFVNAQLIHY